MFKRLLNAVKGGLYRLGIIKGIQKLDQLKDITINEEMYNEIEKWKALYKGYYPKWHDIHYHTVEGKKRRRMDTMNMAKTASSEMASLVFNEKCEISIGDDSLKEFIIDDVFKRNKFNKKFQDYLEYQFAMGGMVIKPYVKDDKIMLSYVTADCFIPLSWENETITEGVFVNQFMKKDKKYTHLEWHLRSYNKEKGWGYTIRNEVYEAQGADDLGIPVSLELFFPGLEKEVGIHPLEKPIFVYFKPNTANNIDTQSPLGISIYANALDTMRSIDTAFDSLHREFRLGKKRIFVPDSMIKVVYDQEGRPHRYFDGSDETYQGYPGDMDENKFHDISVELRVEEHVAAINALLNLFAMQTGFSAGTFTFDGESMKTATEVISEQSKTFKSKQSHEIIIEAGLQELIDSIVAIAELYGLYTAPNKYDVSISFDDSIAEDKGAEIDKQIKRINSGTQSRKRAIMKIEGVTEEEAIAILQEIAEEEKMMAPDLKQLQRESILFGEGE